MGTNATPTTATCPLNRISPTATGPASFPFLHRPPAISTFWATRIDETDSSNPNEDAFADFRFGVVLRLHLIGEKMPTIRTRAFGIHRPINSSRTNIASDGGKLRVTDVDDVTNTYSLSSFFNKNTTPVSPCAPAYWRSISTSTFQVDDRDNRPDLDGDEARPEPCAVTFQRGILVRPFRAGAMPLLRSMVVARQYARAVPR